RQHHVVLKRQVGTVGIGVNLLLGGESHTTGGARKTSCDQNQREFQHSVSLPFSAASHSYENKPRIAATERSAAFPSHSFGTLPGFGELFSSCQAATMLSRLVPARRLVPSSMVM